MEEKVDSDQSYLKLVSLFRSQSIDVRIARVGRKCRVEGIGSGRWMGEAGRILNDGQMSDPYSDTYAIVNNNGDAITADEIKSQTNIQIPPL